ncbi:hypothetical protein SAY86_011851 [Trapa natans]|uniref:Uncharacterized protein n=1 Tax=Trapa natans TaxID=22666 RepID=A0AAN7LW82_TRANT|nr:hypothetical protein SAY86_011851 [Trapa natans]
MDGEVARTLLVVEVDQPDPKTMTGTVGFPLLSCSLSHWSSFLGLIDFGLLHPTWVHMLVRFISMGS